MKIKIFQFYSRKGKGLQEGAKPKDSPLATARNIRPCVAHLSDIYELWSLHNNNNNHHISTRLNVIASCRNNITMTSHHTPRRHHSRTAPTGVPDNEQFELIRTITTTTAIGSVEWERGVSWADFKEQAKWWLECCAGSYRVQGIYWECRRQKSV